jgi:hypothetical protein
MKNLTICLLNWKRPNNINKILDSLYGNVYIFLWDNSGCFPKDSRIDWQIASSINKKCPPRWWMLQQAETDFVCCMDDDLLLKDINILDKLIEFLDNNKNCPAIGGYGKIFNEYLPYKNWGWICNKDTDTNVDLLLGRMILTRKQNLNNILIDESEDDIQLCGLLAKKQRYKFIVPSLLKDQVIELPDDFALWRQTGHFERREQTIDKYWFIDYRNEIGDILKNDIVGCELGVFEGAFSKILINTNKFKKLYLVDTFEGIVHGSKEKIYTDGAVLFDYVKKIFANNTNVDIIKQDSIAFLNSMPENSLDFVYIDTTHKYEQSIKELNAARRAVKSGGLICGHDYMKERFPGVCQAVEEFSIQYNLRYRLTQKDIYKSFFMVNYKK